MMKPMPMAVIGKWTASADNFPIPQSPHTSTLTQTTINILVIAVVSAPPIQFYRTALPTLVRFLSLTHTHSLRKQKKNKKYCIPLIASAEQWKHAYFLEHSLPCIPLQCQCHFHFDTKRHSDDMRKRAFEVRIFYFFFGGDARADGVALTSVAVRLLRSTKAVRLIERGLVALSMLSKCVVNERAPACLPDGASARRGAERWRMMEQLDKANQRRHQAAHTQNKSSKNHAILTYILRSSKYPNLEKSNLLAAPGEKSLGSHQHKSNIHRNSCSLSSHIGPFVNSDEEWSLATENVIIWTKFCCCRCSSICRAILWGMRTRRHEATFPRAIHIHQHE